jgi:thioester reductase-like protein
MKRLIDHMRSYLLWDDSRSNRIIALAGDLSVKRFGLDEETYHNLATKVCNVRN